VLSAVAHGNGPKGMAVVEAAVHALERLDPDHAAVYFQIIYDALREPMRRALEALIMERQTQGKATFPPFAQKIFERGISEGFRDGELKGFQDGELKGFQDGELKGFRDGELKGKHEGELKGKRDVLLRLLARAGIALSGEERNRILACEDGATLDRWAENVLGAKTVADVLS
jgi:flagellar biosynthesis/type III secretory pathway protein FliH